jgi:hypothetical protein
VILLGGLDLAARVSVRWPAGRLVDRQGILGCAGQTRQHSVAEAEGPIVPATVGYGLNREAGPLRELVDDEPTYLFRVDGHVLGHGTETGCVAQYDILV